MQTWEQTFDVQPGKSYDVFFASRGPGDTNAKVEVDVVFKSKAGAVVSTPAGECRSSKFDLQTVPDLLPSSPPRSPYRLPSQHLGADIVRSPSSLGVPRRLRHDGDGDGQGHRRDLRPRPGHLGRLRFLHPEVDATTPSPLRSRIIDSVLVVIVTTLLGNRVQGNQYSSRTHLGSALPISWDAAIASHYLCFHSVLPSLPLKRNAHNSLASSTLLCIVRSSREDRFLALRRRRRVSPSFRGTRRLGGTYWRPAGRLTTRRSTDRRSMPTRSRRARRFCGPSSSALREPNLDRDDALDRDRKGGPPSEVRRLVGVPAVELVVQRPSEDHADEVAREERGDDLCVRESDLTRLELEADILRSELSGARLAGRAGLLRPLMRSLSGPPSALHHRVHANIANPSA